ncbi:TIGR03759 family integrating conjugative element protein (plasmid) [Klebsiella michiganensis]|uniref:TIGR03759 family integrating conjugative element protein n=1 Tax=Klebsiella michiganensis TaxID=1134687 RepID=A0A6P1V6N7_9ENTR|nr:TIGR03759 family integrating conjugative element protein [Klebsiella michiganensis]QHS49702.1 TIGR03759 family integrating conjugative element protein [Klebsiella michiganensis]
MQLKLTFLALVMLSSQALAGTDISVVENSQTTQSQTQSLQQKAGEWGLSPEDYQRYQQLMNGPRGISPRGWTHSRRWGLRPRTPAERRQYAEKWVKEEFARTQKELDFQREINTAWQRLYPDRRGESGECCRCCPGYRGRLALFVSRRTVRPAMRGFLRCSVTIVRLIFTWSTARGVTKSYASGPVLTVSPAEKVRSRQITLNHDGGRWLRFGDGMMPVLLQQGEKGWHIAAF